MKGLEAARAFYDEYGRDMLRREFPEYEGRIAVGLAGHGSECFGYDDAISRDHDYEQGFCLWLDDDTDWEIGFELRKAYRALPRQKAAERSAHGRSPVGVQRIGDFYSRYTGSPGAPESWQQWLHLPSHALAEATNGQVWRDDEGKFTAIRQRILCGMPEDVRRKKLASALVGMAQSGQYNYGRCLKHSEQGAAMLAMGEFVRETAKAIFLLNGSHMPYYKWTLRKMRELERLGGMGEALEYLLCGENDAAGQQTKIQVVEDICANVAEELYAQKLCCGKWDYLERQAQDVMAHIENAQIRALHIMEG